MRCPGDHRMGGWRRTEPSTGPVRFARRCRRRACRHVEKWTITADQIAALRAKVVEFPEHPYVEVGRALIRFTRHGQLYLIPVGA